jgi:Secretion system C-terminal sorting domain
MKAKFVVIISIFLLTNNLHSYAYLRDSTLCLDETVSWDPISRKFSIANTPNKPFPTGFSFYYFSKGTYWSEGDFVSTASPDNSSGVLPDRFGNPLTGGSSGNGCVLISAVQIRGDIPTPSSAGNCDCYITPSIFNFGTKVFLGRWTKVKLCDELIGTCDTNLIDQQFEIEGIPASDSLRLKEYDSGQLKQVIKSRLKYDYSYKYNWFGWRIGSFYVAKLDSMGNNMTLKSVTTGDETSYIKVFTTGQLSLKNDVVKVSRNPVYPGELIEIKGKFSDENNVCIYNIAGEKVASVKGDVTDSALQMEMPFLPSGLYIIKISSNEEVISVKLILR